MNLKIGNWLAAGFGLFYWAFSPVFALSGDLNSSAWQQVPLLREPPECSLCSTPVYQERAPDLIIDGCEPPGGSWEWNLGPPEEQIVLLSSERSLWPCVQLLIGRSYPSRDSLAAIAVNLQIEPCL